MQQPDPNNKGPLKNQWPLSLAHGEKATESNEDLECEKVHPEHSPEKREIRSFHKAETAGIPVRQGQTSTIDVQQ